MGGPDAEGIQRGERAELHQLSFEPNRFANASEAVKQEQRLHPDQCHRLLFLCSS